MTLDLTPFKLLLDSKKYVESKLLQSLRQVAQNPETAEDATAATARLINDYLAVIRGRAGLHRVQQRFEAISLEIKTLDSIFMWTPTNDPLFEGLKIILQHAEKGNLDAVKKTALHMQKIRKNEISERQTAIAKKPRWNPFSKLLDKFVTESPDISEAETLRRLKALVGHGVISRVTELAIEVDVTDPPYSDDIELHRLKDHLYRAKQRRKKLIMLAG